MKRKIERGRGRDADDTCCFYSFPKPISCSYLKLRISLYLLPHSNARVRTYKLHTNVLVGLRESGRGLLQHRARCLGGWLQGRGTSGRLLHCPGVAPRRSPGVRQCGRLPRSAWAGRTINRASSSSSTVHLSTGGGQREGGARSASHRLSVESSAGRCPACAAIQGGEEGRKFLWLKSHARAQ